MLKQKQNKNDFFNFKTFIYFYVGPYIDCFIPYFYFGIYYNYLTLADKLGGTKPLSSETEGCLVSIGL